MKRIRMLRAIRGILPFIAILALVPSYLQAADGPKQWQRGDRHRMHWPQTPDEGFTGIGVSLSGVILADDFRCSAGGQARDIHLWGSFRGDVKPTSGPGSMTIVLSIYSDEAAADGVSRRPGELLWTRTYKQGDYTATRVHDGPEDWYDPVTEVYLAADHRSTYQYDFNVGCECVNLQTDQTYWLTVEEWSSCVGCAFGWKTTLRKWRWGNDALYQLNCRCEDWAELTYPWSHEYEGQSLDLAFVVACGDEPVPQYDLGDAPDGSNNVPGSTMTAYPGVLAHFPTVFDPNSPSPGPMHRHPRDRFYLGRWVSLETQADVGVDEDAFRNLDLQNNNDLADQDGGDDGLELPVVMPPCGTTTLNYTVTVASAAMKQAYVNVWCDWNRDGDWNDTVSCPAGNVPEWAVQNQLITWSGLGKRTFTTPAFTCWHPDMDEIDPLWLRITIAEQPTGSATGGAGPVDGYQYGETEDYYVEPVADCTAVECDLGGVTIPPLIKGESAAVTAQIREGGGVVQGWVDFNGDGAYVAADKVCDVFLPAGVHVIRFPVPFGSIAGPTTARFRISRQGGLDPYEPSCDCEIEDHQVRIDEPPDVCKAWRQWPDASARGVDIRVDNGEGVSRAIADDFECACPGKLTHVRLWGAWKDDCRGEIKKIHLAIRPDDPVGPYGSDRTNLYPKPGPEILWHWDVSPGYMEQTVYHQMSVGGEWWWDPECCHAMALSHKELWQIDIEVPSQEAFTQQGTPSNPRTYWLSVEVETATGEFGWMTRQWPDHSGGDAVRLSGSGMQRTWQELYYPLVCHPYYDVELNSIDMAFCLEFSVEKCPGPVTTRPMTATYCPVVETACPAMETQCPALVTHCPSSATRCPVEITCCPIVETVCPTGETQCPASATHCPVEITCCPITITQCYAMPTSCPAVQTVCPVNQTMCPSFTTICPPTTTQCPATSCPPPCPQCPPVSLDTDSASNSERLAVLASCPAVQADCLTVDQYELQWRASRQ
jgi:hypothetical protein